MDPVIVVGAGPVGLTLSLALAAQGVPCVLLDEGPGTEEVRLARTVVLREDTADLVERLGAADLEKDGLRWSGWRSMRRKQLVREVPLGAGSEGSHDAGAPETSMTSVTPVAPMSRAGPPSRRLCTSRSTLWPPPCARRSRRRRW